MYDLKKIKTRAMELYQSGILPPENLKQAMIDLGVPEDAMWGVRENLRKLEAPTHPPIEPKKHTHKKKVVSAVPGGPPKIDWRGNMTVRVQSIDLAELNKRDGKLAAAHDED